MATPMSIDSSLATVEMVDLGKKAKIMSGFMGIRNTVTHVPKTLLMHVLDPCVRDKNIIGEGHEYYNHANFRLQRLSEPIDTQWSTTETFLLGADSQGRTVTARIIGLPFFVYVECPNDFDQSRMDRMAEYFRKKYRLGNGDVGAKQEWNTRFCYWEPNGDDVSKTRLYNYCVLSFPNIKHMKWAASSLKKGVSIYDCGIVNHTFPVHECEVAPTHKALERMNILPSAWCRIENWKIPKKYYTHNQIEVEVHWKDIYPENGIDDIPPMKYVSFDIETYCNDGTFCNSSVPEDVIICISSYVREFGKEEPLARVCHHLLDVEEGGDVDGTTVFEYDDEKVMLDGWADFMTLDIQPQFRIGHRSIFFDEKYIAERAELLSDNYSRCHVFLMSMFIDEVSELRNKEMNSKARGDNTFRWIGTSGCIPLDTYWLLKSSVNYPSYNLKDVCEYIFGIGKEKLTTTDVGIIFSFLESRVLKLVPYSELAETLKEEDPIKGDSRIKDAIETLRQEHGYEIATEGQSYRGEAGSQECVPAQYCVLTTEISTLRKIDLPFHLLWSNWINGKRAENIRYCMKDSELPAKIISKLLFIPEHIEMSRLTMTPYIDLMIYGQQRKTTNLLLYYCHKYKCVLNHEAVNKEEYENSEGYEGALVFDPMRGYYDIPIATLDFASLYPSIMQHRNLCYSTLAKDRWVQELLKKKCPTKVDESIKEIFERTSDEISKEGTVCDGTKKVTLSQCFEGSGARYVVISPTEDQHNIFVQHCVGILPRILATLKQGRAEAKAKLKKFAPGSLMYTVLDKRQLIIKLTANSVYGFTGAIVGSLPCLEISSSVTCMGREMILETKNYVEKDFEKYSSDEFALSVKLPPIPREIKSIVKDAVVIYGDTDSVMVAFRGLMKNKSGVRWCLAIAKLASLYITLKFKKHEEDKDVVLELEKCYFPYLLINRKMYAGVIWMNPDKPEKTDTKGLPSKRRDKWLGLRETLTKCLNAILYDMNLDKAKRVVVDLLERAVGNKLSLEDYTISKSLKKDYKNATSPPEHVVVRNKIRARAEGSEPRCGDRVPYVITEGPQENVAQRAEHPDYLLVDPRVKIDRAYYVESLVKPFTKILRPCFENPERFFTDALEEIKIQRYHLANCSRFAKPRNCRKTMAMAAVANASPTLSDNNSNTLGLLPSNGRSTILPVETIVSKVKQRDFSSNYQPPEAVKETRKRSLEKFKSSQPMKIFCKPRTRRS